MTRSEREQAAFIAGLEAARRLVLYRARQFDPLGGTRAWIEYAADTIEDRIRREKAKERKR